MRADRVVLAVVVPLLLAAGVSHAAEPRPPPGRELRRRTLTIDDQSLGSPGSLVLAASMA